MYITNTYNLPTPVVHAVTHDRYDPGDGDVSCTTLIAPAQIFQLRRTPITDAQGNEVTDRDGKLITLGDFAVEDASLRIWSLMGSAVHYVLENACESMRKEGVWDGESITERRFYHVVGGKKVSAQIDLYHENDLNDFKLTSVWTIKDAMMKGKDEWTAQLNIQAYLMEKNGIKVNRLWIMAFARDWNKAGKLRDKYYPPRAARIALPRWTTEKTEEYIMSRLNALYSPYLIPCSPEEMWETPAKYALMKKGRVKALRLLDSYGEAVEYGKGIEACSTTLDEQDGPKIVFASGYYIDFRPGERKRCKDYCDMAPFCEQYKQWKRETGEKSNEENVEK